MAHTVHNPKRLLARVARIRGQVQAIDKALLLGQDCSEMLQLVSSCRGALNGLMYELIEGHLEHHVVGGAGPKKSNHNQKQASEQLLSVIRTYLK